VKHPSIDRLALYAGGELPFWTRWIMRRHMTGCAQCQEEISLFGEVKEAVREETGVMPAGVNWERLSAEMGANVRLGLAASDAIRAYRTPIDEAPAQGMSWRMVALTSAFVLLLSVGYWFNAAKKSEQMAAMRGPEPFVAQASGSAVEMSDGSKAMVLQMPKSNTRPAIITVSTTGSAGAQYVDEETGQVTVNNVYVE